jgi:hypothetical protein
LVNREFDVLACYAKQGYCLPHGSDTPVVVYRLVRDCLGEKFGWVAQQSSWALLGCHPSRTTKHVVEMLVDVDMQTVSQAG